MYKSISEMVNLIDEADSVFPLNNFEMDFIDDMRSLVDKSEKLTEKQINQLLYIIGKRR